MDKQKRWLFSFVKLVTIPALFLLVLLAGSMTAYAAESYDLYIGSTQVTEANKNNILSENNADGQPTASYDPVTATLTLKGVNISADNNHYYDGYDCECSLYSGTDVVKNLEITGENCFVSKDGGIYFELSDETAFRITGTGTLTSTATESGGSGFNAAMCIDNKDGNRNIGYVYMGKEDGTGPTLKLTASNTGADFSNVCTFNMQGGTIIAQANGTSGAGVTLPVDAYNVCFNGGTIAGYGTYDDNEGCGGAFEGTGGVDYSQLGMQLVYPEPTEGETNYEYTSGWCVVGMTKGDHVADTQAVLVELGLAEKTDPVAGENGRYHTDVVPDPGVYFDVQGYTKNTTVYSVDVEWGAMTFEYEVSSWDPVNHKTTSGAGWRVYDSTSDTVITDTQHSINHVTVTNHSNAQVFATLSYEGIDSNVGITGGFSKKADDADTKFTAASGDFPDYLTLDTADNNEVDAAAGQGRETVGTVYFMPEGIGTTDGTINNIAKWTKIGKITVGILTELPATQP